MTNESMSAYLRIKTYLGMAGILLCVAENPNDIQFSRPINKLREDILKNFWSTFCSCCNGLRALVTSSFQNVDRSLLAGISKTISRHFDVFWHVC